MSDYNYSENNHHAGDEPQSHPVANGSMTNGSGGAAYGSVPASPQASIEKVRDILFGSQTKNNEARFLRLEEGLAREIFELRDLLKNRIESLEAFFSSETQALAERLRKEREERMTAFEAHHQEMNGALAALARRLGDLNIAMNEGDSTVRRELMQESRRLVNEIGVRHESVRGLMESRVSELHNRKADRAVISDLMREMAKQLDKDEVEPVE